MRLRADVGLAFAILLLAAGYLGGRRESAPPPPPAPLPAPRDVAVHPPHAEPATERPPAFDPRLTGLALPALLDERGKVGDGNAGRAAAIDGELRRRMSEDPAVLEDLLGRFKAAPDRLLAALLGSFRHPRVEQAALELAAPGGPREARRIAFEVLDRLDHLAPENHAVLLGQLRLETDPELLAEGLYALPHGPAAPELRAASRDFLRGAVEHATPRVRAQALLALGLGALEDVDLPAVLGRLGDGAAEVRATAASALRNYRGGQGAAVQAALAARMGDVAEAPEVRRQAWQTLSGYPMDAPTWEAWSAYRRATRP